MIIIGVDYHPEFQQIAAVDTDTESVREQRLAHCEDAEEFYRALHITFSKGEREPQRGAQFDNLPALLFPRYSDHREEESLGSDYGTQPPA